MNGTSVKTRVLLAIAFAFLVAPGVSGCTSNGGTAGWTAAPDNGAAAPASQPGVTGHQSMSAAMEATWTNRPAYVRADPRTEEAYAYAAAHPEVVQWMPCYCGCDAMDHRSNLDCFFKPTNDGVERLTFEEHASYCEVCVDEALMAKEMSGQGQSLRAIRDAIDQQFSGNGVRGTQTALPPA